VLGVFEEREERRVLGEIRLELGDSDAGSVLQPPVLEVRVYSVEAS
jgi:hypothetical protein